MSDSLHCFQELDLPSQLRLLQLTGAGSPVERFTLGEQKYLLGLCRGLPLKVTLLAKLFKECGSAEAAKLELDEIRSSSRLPGHQAGLDTVFLYSYEALDRPLRKAFLNVALFLPQGFQCDVAILASNAGNWNRMLDCPANWLDRLANRSMVTLQSTKAGSQIVTVHDALVEFAAEYVSEHAK